MFKAILFAIVPFVSILKMYDILENEMCIAMTLTFTAGQGQV